VLPRVRCTARSVQGRTSRRGGAGRTALWTWPFGGPGPCDYTQPSRTQLPVALD
jgi:hypothetical protein